MILRQLTDRCAIESSGGQAEIIIDQMVGNHISNYPANKKSTAAQTNKIDQDAATANNTKNT